MTRDPLVYVDDILESIARIQEYTSDLTEEEFLKNTEKQDAVIRRLEIIGEAVKNLPEKIRDHYDDIPWRKIAGLRDVLIHEYSGVKEKRVWKVIDQNLSEVKDKARQIKKEHEEEGKS